MNHYHDFCQIRIIGIPITRWACSCGIKTWRTKNVDLLQSTTTTPLPD